MYEREEEWTEKSRGEYERGEESRGDEDRREERNEERWTLWVAVQDMKSSDNYKDLGASSLIT